MAIVNKEMVLVSRKREKYTWFASLEYAAALLGRAKTRKRTIVSR